MLCGEFIVTRFGRKRDGIQGFIREMNSVNVFIREMELIDFPLFDRKFSWGNMRDSPVFAKLDSILSFN